MKEEIFNLIQQANGDFGLEWNEEQKAKFAKSVIEMCAKELREAELEAVRAFKAKEVSEINTFNGYDLAEMLEDRFVN